jgi:hypothetical protein
MTSGGWNAAGGTDCRSVSGGAAADPSGPPGPAAVVAGWSAPPEAAGSACFAAADLADRVLVARARVAVAGAGAPSSPLPAGLSPAGPLLADVLSAALSPA